MKSLLLSASLFAIASCGSSTPAETTTPNGQAEEATETATSEEVGSGAMGVENARDFTLKDTAGNDISLASYSGKTVVLEWFNPKCPYIVYAHGEGPLKTMANEVNASGDVVWLAINSGKTAEVAMNQKAITDWGMKVPVLLDPTGSVGQAFGAKSTPHLFVLDGAGEVVYQGALDNAPRGEKDGEYVNYIEKALGELAAGQPVSEPETQAYGCSVKY